MHDTTAFPAGRDALCEGRRAPVRRVLTYGTFDLLHHGHVRLLKRARALGDFLVVALSTDEFNALKGKHAYHGYDTRKEVLEAIRYVDLVIPESAWEQKIDDVRDHAIDVVVMGDDWAGSDRFDFLKEHCELVFLPRTEGVSTTEIKEDLGGAS
jgi:glycerol-3-phosphate cytidylyltransferase